jgi:hypothetical protein
MMGCRGFDLCRLGVMAGVVWTLAGFAAAQEGMETVRTEVRLPLDEMPPAVRDKIRQTLDKPTISARGPIETFPCYPPQYYWLLDHPDRAVYAWHRLGAHCVDVADRGEGRFGWSDENGSDVHWDTVYQTKKMRVWYAEGKVRGAALLPLHLVRVVVVLHFTEDRDEAGRVVIRHQAEMALHTDSKALSLAARLFGASVPKLADQYMSQLEMFYSALAWYFDQHPRQVEALLAPPGPSAIEGEVSRP